VNKTFYILTNKRRKSNLMSDFSAIWNVNFFVGKLWNFIAVCL